MCSWNFLSIVMEFTNFLWRSAGINKTTLTADAYLDNLGLGEALAVTLDDMT